MTGAELTHFERPDRSSLARKRLTQLLDRFAGEEEGTQQQLASRAGLTPQYLADLKHGRRSLTELAARRLGQELNVSFEWLLGRTEDPSSTGAVSSTVWLALLPHPIEGEPKRSKHWEGRGVDVSGLAAASLHKVVMPYVLEYGNKDVANRLRAGDLILMSQADSARAEIKVVRHGGKLFLARQLGDGRWQRAANGQELPADRPIVGHCISILWGSLIDPARRRG